MASSQPTSSPTRSVSPDRFDLSPQSRLRKLLATVESDSDGENTPKKTLKQPQFTRLSSPASDHDSKARATSKSQNDEDNNDIRPRGRVAGRMQGVSKEGDSNARGRVREMLAKSATRDQSQNTNAGHGSEDDGVIASRPRGRLASRMQGAAELSMGEAKKPDSESQATAISVTRGEEAGDVEMADADDDDDDEDIPVRRRKPVAKPIQSATPEPIAQTPRKEASPGLFVTPSKSSPTAADSGDESDLPAINSDRFKALVEKKRKERLAREADEARKREARAAALEELGDDSDDDVSDISDDDGGRKLTQTHKQSRPSRKASKKALEEMNRETQRMQRAMQLAHEAKTKKKITKASLFERFNYKPAGNAFTKEKQQSSSRPQTPSSMKSMDAEMQDAETPPSSPPVRVQDVLGKGLGSSASTGGVVTSNGVVATTSGSTEDDEDLPDIFDMQAFARKPLNKGKKTATTPAKAVPKRHVRVKLPPIQVNRVSLVSDDEDNLIVIDEKKTKLDALFERVPKNQSKESSSLRMLRQLAHLNSPERKAHKQTDKSAMTPGELQAFLRQQAREQAKLERERRLESLKAKGIYIQTEEERERDREQIEDMVARARREAEEIMDRERDEAKIEKKVRGEDPLSWEDSGSDDDYVEDKNAEDEAEADVDFSGSEEDDNEEGPIALEDDDDEEQEPEQTPKQTSVAHKTLDDVVADAFDDEASGTEQSWADPDEEEERHRWGKEDESMDATPAFVQAMRPKGSFASVHDDEDLEVEATPKPSKFYSTAFTPKPATSKTMGFTPGPNNNTSPEIPTSVLRSAAKTFIPGLPVDAGGPAGLGLTQIFAGTMDDSQADPLGGSPSQPMPTLNDFPGSQFSQHTFESADSMILDSQSVPASQEDKDESQVRLEFFQSQTHGLDSLLRDHMATQSSEMFDPSQDNGFQAWTPLKERFVEPPVSTIDTVIRDPSDAEDMSHDSPLLQKRSRIRKKAVIASESEDDGSDGAIKPSAFRVLKDAAAQEKKRKAREQFNKKKSKAKEMVEEQAEESEDEYAGLGGVDGEDSDDDDAASVREMIDDHTQGSMEDEVKIAALHAYVILTLVMKLNGVADYIHKANVNEPKTQSRPTSSSTTSLEGCFDGNVAPIMTCRIQMTAARHVVV